jgi:DNA/RNA non-specific endonuclease
MATQLSSVAPTTTSVPRAPAPKVDPKAEAARILNDTRIGSGDKAAHRIGFIEAKLDKIADTDPALAAAVRIEVMKGLSTTEQAQLQRAEPGIMRDAGNGQTVRFSTTSTKTQDQWIAEARAGNYRDLAIYTRLAGANDNASIKRVMNDVFDGKITPSEFAAAGAAVDEKGWTDSVGDFLANFSPAGMALEAAQPAIAKLTRDAGLGKTEWGASLQKILDTPGTARAFNAGVATGLVDGAKDFVVSIASLAGKAIQFGADNSIIGNVGDAARSVVPDSVKGWLRDIGIGGALNEVVPSANRGQASSEALGKMGSAVVDYFASKTPEQVATDIKNGIGKIWDSVKADHAKAAAKGPEAEARWWGKLVGRVTFEVASTFVPIAGQAGKGAKVAKGVETAGEVLSVADKTADALRAEEAARKAIKGGEVVVEGGRAAQVATRIARIGRNEVTWTLDAAGRPIEANATLREVFTGLKRSSAEVKAQGEVGGAARLATDEGGHIIGHRFVKDQGIGNMFPQNANLNKGAFKKVENELADWVNAGGEVRVKVTLKDAANGRPEKIVVSYEVINPKTGEVVFDNVKQFRNVANESFDRVAKKDMAALLK